MMSIMLFRSFVHVAPLPIQLIDQDRIILLSQYLLF